MRIGRLEFRCIDVSARSVAAGELAPDCRKGIYFYLFDDGSAYVGKSIDMVKRHAQHLHEYRHRDDFQGVGISKAYFASVDEKMSDAELDELETRAIRQAEADGYSLRNKLKTSLPGGKGDLILDLSEDKMLFLPWERAARTNVLEPAAMRKPAESHKKRFARFMKLPEHEVLLEALSMYVHNTMPEPAHTAGIYWTANAYPGRGSNVLPVCITCATLETLTVISDEGRLWGFLNIKCPEGSSIKSLRGELNSVRKRAAEFSYYFRYAPYDAAEDVVRFVFHDLCTLREALKSPALLDWAYRLNVECFRKGKNPRGKDGNPLLMQAILDRLNPSVLLDSPENEERSLTFGTAETVSVSSIAAVASVLETSTLEEMSE